MRKAGKKAVQKNTRILFVRSSAQTKPKNARQRPKDVQTMLKNVRQKQKNARTKPFNAPKNPTSISGLSNNRWQ